MTLEGSLPALMAVDHHGLFLHFAGAACLEPGTVTTTRCDASCLSSSKSASSGDETVVQMRQQTRSVKCSRRETQGAMLSNVVIDLCAVTRAPLAE